MGYSPRSHADTKISRVPERATYFNHVLGYGTAWGERTKPVRCPAGPAPNPIGGGRISLISRFLWKNWGVQSKKSNFKQKTRLKSQLGKSWFSPWIWRYLNIRGVLKLKLITVLEWPEVLSLKPCFFFLFLFLCFPKTSCQERVAGGGAHRK